MALLNLPPIEDPPPMVDSLEPLNLSPGWSQPPANASAGEGAANISGAVAFAAHGPQALPDLQVSQLQALYALDRATSERLPMPQPSANHGGPTLRNQAAEALEIGPASLLMPESDSEAAFPVLRLELAAKLPWYAPSLTSAGCRIVKRPPQPQFVPAQPSGHPENQFELDPKLGPHPSQHSLLRIPGIEAIDWKQTAEAFRLCRGSVEPWLVPPRPINPAWREEPRKFDWAQLIARLADFETSRHQVPSQGPVDVAPVLEADRVPPPKPNYTFQNAAEAAARFWQSQSWPVRALVMTVPLFAAFLLKPVFDGVPSEPVVLAKSLPPAPSTVLRRMPAREKAQERAKGNAGKKRTDAPAQVEKPDLPIATVEPKLTNVDRMLLERAAVELADDFSFGLDSWDANNANAATWTYDATGFIRPRGLALYRPSMNLTNYSVEFLAKIDVAAIGWVVRAVDHNNYHAVKLVQRGSGPLPRYTIVRYSVVNGREGPRIEHPLPLNLYKDTLFRIRMDIRGSDYSILVQDSVVDSWSDDRFQFGGTGFFAGHGEQSRVRWVQITYQNDLLGKICAWLSPKTS